MGYIPGGEREMKYNVEKMIAELCPTGVLYCEMGKLAQIGTGKSNGNEAEDNGEYPFFIRSPIVKRKNCYEYDEEAIIIPGEGGVGDIFHYINGKYALHQRVYRIHFTTKDVDTRFMYYYLSANFKVFIQRKAVNATVTSIRKPMIEQVPIPLHPLPIQQEIVRILDTFTNLTAELTAELTARRKQYEYYRDELLTFGEDVDYKTLPEISVNCDRQRKPVTKGKRNSGSYPYYGASGIVDYVSDYIFEGDYLLISEDGANLLARSTPIAFSISGKNWVNNHAHVLKFETDVMRKYVEIYLNSIGLERYISGGAQPKLNQDNLNKIPIPVPENHRIQTIVDILTKFDKLCNDLGAGIPAEVSARQKQYEYYRGKLLRFS
jgi:type I restriction enzyme S subunit